MDPWHLKDVELVKSCKAQQKSGNPLAKIGSLIRVVEICVVLIFVSRFSTELPGAVKNSGEYLRVFKFVLISPQFVFVIGNAIIITLFVKSGQLSPHEQGRKNDYYAEFVEQSVKGKDQEHRRSVLEFQDKETIREEVRKVPAKDCKRTRSEDLRHEHVAKPQRFLRWSESEGLVLEKKDGLVEDKMSNEEFRRTVEAFIERQQRFLREEEYAVML
ncbi:hypothetical protein MLD38_013855 [Melastoma candidum]|uniref:Uncharacterized protein n=1 Tax=Melastoma candidum TaxID=119954 RepID=A0ACB9RAW1_9MYRT|nr:hypothetical protein MLD38_013855 [Melastoma candidum]